MGHGLWMWIMMMMMMMMKAGRGRGASKHSSGTGAAPRCCSLQIAQIQAELRSSHRGHRGFGFWSFASACLSRTRCCSPGRNLSLAFFLSHQSRPVVREARESVFCCETEGSRQASLALRGCVFFCGYFEKGGCRPPASRGEGGLTRSLIELECWAGNGSRLRRKPSTHSDMRSCLDQGSSSPGSDVDRGVEEREGSIFAAFFLRAWP